MCLPLKFPSLSLSFAPSQGLWLIRITPNRISEQQWLSIKLFVCLFAFGRMQLVCHLFARIETNFPIDFCLIVSSFCVVASFVLFFFVSAVVGTSMDFCLITDTHCYNGSNWLSFEHFLFYGCHFGSSWSVGVVWMNLYFFFRDGREWASLHCSDVMQRISPSLGCVCLQGGEDNHCPLDHTLRPESGELKTN